MKQVRNTRFTPRALGLLLTGVLLLGGLAACSRANIDNKEAVAAAMAEYLAARDDMGLDPDAMDIVVNAVQFERDTARASVSFLIKGTSEGMDMNYTLVRDGDKWVVEGRQDAAVAPHGFEGAIEGEAGAIDSGAELPEGHVPVEPGGETGGGVQ